jgi:hypothetical protein
MDPRSTPESFVFQEKFRLGNPQLHVSQTSLPTMEDEEDETVIIPLPKPYQATLNVPFLTQGLSFLLLPLDSSLTISDHATIVMQCLTVDEELQPQRIEKTFELEGSNLKL